MTSGVSGNAPRVAASQDINGDNVQKKGNNKITPFQVEIKAHDPSDSASLKNRGSSPVKRHYYGTYFEVGAEYPDSEMLAFYDSGKLSAIDKP